MGDFTEELIQSIALAQRQGKCIGSVQQRIKDPSAPGSCCHGGTSSASKQHPIVQGLADGNVAVIGHDGENAILCSKQEKKEEDLSSTSQAGRKSTFCTV